MQLNLFDLSILKPIKNLFLGSKPVVVGASHIYNPPSTEFGIT